ncbi:MAG: hypothetical protein JO249_05230, partial [Acidobacteria bacterium]|nr:hypothetical protein [Acidobacteriota bacterium]
MKTGITALVLMLNILPSGAFAATVVVGPRGCHQGSPHFSTIQAAVNAAPGGNVLVCPGTYPEQVVISTPLVLKGVSYKNSSAATITPPSGGMVANTQTSSWLYSNNGVSSVAAQISVQNTHDVAISNLTIDGGSTANCSISGTGIDLYNSGIPSHQVSVSNVVVQNTCGIGILSDSSLITIQASDVYNTGWSGIFVVQGSYFQIQVLRNTV